VFSIVHGSINHGTRIAAAGPLQELRNSDSTLKFQVLGAVSGIMSTCFLSIAMLVGNAIVEKNNWETVDFWIFHFCSGCDAIANMMMALLFSGALTGTWSACAQDQKLEAKREQRLAKTAAKYRPDSNAEWQSKVEELAGRAFTLEALLIFYMGLGKDYMDWFDPNQNSTNDVVRGAIIPMTKESQTSLATVMMKGKYTRPNKMVTHNWGNLFRDLVAAIVADALEEDQFCHIAALLNTNPEKVAEWVYARNAHLRTYWVCAFSVNQHAGICAGNPQHTRDAVTGIEHATCNN